MSNYPFRYRPLESGHIRCLKILPANHSDDPIVVKIKHRSLASEHTRFDTLSYTWGAINPQHQICVNDGQGHLAIRENCWHFLKHWRKIAPDLDWWIWIDAICINQADDNEKAEQVRQMKEVFTRARRVLVWLGRVSEDTALPDLFDKHASSLMPHPAHWDPSSKDYNTYKESLNKFHDLCFPSHIRFWSLEQTNQAVRQLRHILISEYWTRLWIIQEAALAKTHCFILGNTLYSAHDMDTVYETIHIIKGIFDNYSNTSKGVPFMAHIIHLMRNHFHTRTWNAAHHHLPSRTAPMKPVTQKSSALILDLTEQFQDHQCSDFRDRIYGLLSLTTHGAAFEIDYQASPEDLLVGILKNVVLEQKAGPGRLDTNDHLINIHHVIRACELFWSLVSKRIGDAEYVHSLHAGQDSLNHKFHIIFPVHDILRQNVVSSTWTRIEANDFCNRPNENFWNTSGLEFRLSPSLSELAVQESAPRQMWLINIGHDRRHIYLVVNSTHKATDLLICKPPCSCYTLFGEMPDPNEWENGIFLEDIDEVMGTFLWKHLDPVQVGTISRALLHQPSSRTHPVGQGFSCVVSAAEILEFSRALRACVPY